MLTEIANDNLEAGSRGARQPSVVPDLDTLLSSSVLVPPEQSQKWCRQEQLMLFHTAAGGPSDSLSLGDVVTVKRKYPSLENPEWAEIDQKVYSYNKGQWIVLPGTSWVSDFYLDDYNEVYPSAAVEIERSSGDRIAKQYMMWDDRVRDGEEPQEVQVNMCGELCVAYIIKNEIDKSTTLEAVLKKWLPEPSYNLGKIRVGLKAPEIQKILGLYEELQNRHQSFLGLTAMLPSKGLKDSEWLQRLSALQNKLTTHYLIALVTINKVGTLISTESKEKQISHWLVVEEIIRDGWGVKLYNPFPNKLQEYSLTEFVSSCQNTGIWVERKQQLQPRERDEKDWKVGLDLPKPAGYAAEQYIDRVGEAVKKKTRLCGEFCVTYILDQSVDQALSHWMANSPSDVRQLAAILGAYGADRWESKSFTIGTVLDYWKTIQPETYQKIVVPNEDTRKEHLQSLLKLYGYKDTDFRDFGTSLIDPHSSDNRAIVSPVRMQTMLKDHLLIVGVGIKDDLKGRLAFKGPIRHWVVVERIDPVERFYSWREAAGNKGREYYLRNLFPGNGGWVTLYNPYMNRREIYSFQEFAFSMDPDFGNMGDGFWVKRKIEPGPLTWVDPHPVPSEEALAVQLPEAVKTWIHNQAGVASAFAAKLVQSLQEAGVLAITDDPDHGKIGTVSKVSLAEPAIEGANPAEKVANVVGRMLAVKAQREINSMG